MRFGYWAMELAVKLTVTPSSAPIYCSSEADVNAPSMAISSCFSPFDWKSQMEKRLGLVWPKLDFIV